MSRLNGMATLNGQQQQSRKAAPARAQARTVDGRRKLRHFRTGITVALGAGIPALSLALSKIAGTLASGGYYPLAVLAAAVGATVLAVSLQHLQAAVRDITRSRKVPSWCLAVAIDLSLVTGELVHVYAPSAGLALVVTLVMVSVMLVSMMLNTYAFLTPHKEE